MRFLICRTCIFEVMIIFYKFVMYVDSLIIMYPFILTFKILRQHFAFLPVCYTQGHCLPLPVNSMVMHRTSILLTRTKSILHRVLTRTYAQLVYAVLIYVLFHYVIILNRNILAIVYKCSLIIHYLRYLCTWLEFCLYLFNYYATVLYLICNG